MQTVVLIIHVLISVSLIAVVMLQKSEGGGLGLGGGGGGGMSGLMTGRSTANLLTRTTSVLFAAFLMTSIVLALLAARERGAAAGSILDKLAPSGAATAQHSAPAAPTGAPAKPSAPAAPAAPSVPLAK
jgi:preprotein translocase subunit SecG